MPKGGKICSIVLNLLRSNTTYAQLADTRLINTVLLLSFIHSFIHYAFIQSIVVLGQVHRVQPTELSTASYCFLLQLPDSSRFLKESSSCFRLLPRFLVTSAFSVIFLSITCFRMQFIRKIRPIRIANLLFIVCKLFLSSLTLRNTSSFLIRSVQLIAILLQHHISKLPRHFWPNFRRV